METNFKRWAELQDALVLQLRAISYYLSQASNQMATHFELSKELRAQYSDIDEFLLYKWVRVFAMFFDTNLSKAVDWSDFYLVARRARDIYGADSTQMQFAKDSLNVLWDELCKSADTNNDNIVSTSEWIELLRKGDAEHLPKWLKDYASYMFKLFDVSGDNVIDIAEYTDGMSSYGYNAESAKDAFQHLAVDEKGEQIPSFGPQHWKKLFTEYFFVTNKNAAGNHLFGTLES